MTGAYEDRVAALGRHCNRETWLVLHSLFRRPYSHYSISEPWQMYLHFFPYLNLLCGIVRVLVESPAKESTV